jgi:ankyrin repeat protein
MMKKAPGSHVPQPSSWDSLLAAVLDNDLGGVQRFLIADPALTGGAAPSPRFYESIVHWMYAGDSALHLAAATHRPQICQILLNAGSDPNSARNHRRSTPLHYAADGYVNNPAWNPRDQVATLDCLLKSGAHLDARDMNGATPLHRAVRTRCAEAVKYLLSRGADPLIQNKNGSTPFHLAVQNTGRGGTGADIAKLGQKQILVEFLAFGLNPKERDRDGKSVLDCARSDWIRELLSGKSAQ